MLDRAVLNRTRTNECVFCSNRLRVTSENEGILNLLEGITERVANAPSLDKTNWNKTLLASREEERVKG